MEGQEYLNQLAAEARPTKQKNGLLSSKTFIVLLIALVVVVLFGIVMGIINGNKGGEQKLGTTLKLHIDNTSTIIQTYQPKVKSSDLRSSSASLYSVLSNTTTELTDYLVEKYNFKPKKVDKKVTAEADEASEELDAELFEAKINGNLDRIYAHKMAYEISLFLAEEAKLMETSKNETLDELLKKSYDSLENLYPKFNDFSETKTIRKE